MKIGIIGGGISGLTTALALHKVGVQSTVFEQSDELNEIGAGIWLQPNAVRVLDWLGLKSQVQKHGIELNKMEITDSQLQPIKEIKSKIVHDEKGNKTIAIHRARLQRILYDEVNKITSVQLNKVYKEHHAQSGTIHVNFESGEEEKVDFLIGTDGINSKVRQNLFHYSTTRSAQQVCWRGVAKTTLPDEVNRLGLEAWGNQIRFGFSTIHKNEVYWFAVAHETHLNKAKNTGYKKYLSDLFQSFSPIVTELITNTEEDLIHQSILHDLNRLDKWHSGNICLVGDAAHATTPNMGQGAGQGIEDAFYLSKLCAKLDQNKADVFKEFEMSRRKKVDYIVNNSWRFGKMAHSRIGQPIMKMMLKLTPESVMNAQMNKVYAIDC